MGYRRNLIWVLVAVVSFTLLEVPLLRAEEEEFEGGVKVKGFLYNIAKDRKVKKIGGQYQAEGLDIYISRHLNRLHNRVNDLEKQMKGVRSDVRQLTVLIQGKTKKTG